MTIKTLLFLLVLYICLVWVGAAYLHPESDFRDFGLKWTLIGLIGVIAFVVGNHLLGWWRLWRAKPARREKPASKPAPIVHEDDTALAAALAEANATLAKAPDYMNQRRPLYRLPWRLIIGPAGSGKTSLLVNSGLEPQLLAGHARETETAASTRLCNIWLAKNTIFIEVAGRFFDGDIARWNQLLRVMRGTETVPLWKRLLGQREQTGTLRGVIACSDLRQFTGASADPQPFERYCRNWYDRLRVVGEVFGSRYPVYKVITKCDGIPFFQQYFRQLSESESQQVLGCTLPLGAVAAPAAASEVFAEVESKRLTRAFRALYQSLAERRITQLAYEPKTSLRPDIYEFPRELKRIRGPIVQFLIDAFRPDALRPAPVLRGYYFSAVREVEGARISPPKTEDWQTVIARRAAGADATKMFNPEASIVGINEPSGHMIRRWSFLADLFHRVVLVDVPIQSEPPVDARFAQYRRRVLVGVVGTCAVLCAAFFISWVGNRRLLRDVEAAASIPISPGEGTIDDLRKLDALRSQVARLRTGGSWWMHMGLYSGNRILDATRTAYFQRFHQLLLGDLNRAITGQLKVVATEPYDPVYRALKTHITISSGKCAVEPVLVSEVLRGVRGEIDSQKEADWQRLSDEQIEFYAQELVHGNPTPLGEDAEAVEHGREYLRKVRGVDRVYSAILADVRHTLAKPRGLADVAPNYAQALRGPSEPPSGFSIDGWAIVLKKSKDEKLLPGDCVLGDSVQTEDSKPDPQKRADLSPDIQRLYVREYIQHWREFVNAHSVGAYSSPDDAVKKLDILSSNRSPLLGLLALTANQTNFEAEGVQKAIESAITTVGKALPIGTKSQKPAEVSGTPAEITQFFQPVHWVVPPNSELWVTEKSAAYLESLAQLRGAMQTIANAGSADAASRMAATQAAAPIYNNALSAVSQIARGFKPNGLDQVVQRLLEDPIRAAKRFIDADITGITASEINGKLGPVCRAFTSVADKYPFRRSATQEVTLDELSSWLAPETGQIWKFQMTSLAQMTQRETSEWKGRVDPSSKLQITPEMLLFLNRNQVIRDLLYAKGGPQPQMSYSLRPRLDAAFTSSSILELEVDGQIQQFTSVLQKRFDWPAAPGAKPGAIARIRTGGVAAAFLSHSGTWGIFRMMDDAEMRTSGTHLIEWKYSSAGGQRDPIQPAPVRMEFAELPNGADVFHRDSFEGMRCPMAAVR